MIHLPVRSDCGQHRTVHYHPKQLVYRLGCRGAVYPGQFNFTAKILVTEIKGQAPHPAVLRPWLQFSARWPLPR